MRPGRLAAAIPVILAVAACHTPTAGSDLPALIVRPDEASKMALEKTLTGLFGDHPVALADDALTQSSMLTLDITPRQSVGGEAVLGRVLQGPYRFQLVKRQDNCFLVDLRDGKRYLLRNTSCTPE
jgi:hypothetical protein